MRTIFIPIFLFLIIIAGNQREQFAVDLSPYVDMDDAFLWPDGIYFIYGAYAGYMMEIRTVPNIIYGIVQEDNINVMFIIESL